MSKQIPTRSQCLRAARRLPLHNGVYRTRVKRPLIRGDGDTTNSTPALLAGALLIAADDSVRDVNAALRRATELMFDWLPLQQHSFSREAAPLALLFLRNGWRRKLPDEERAAAEHNAQVDADLGTPLVFNPDPSPDDAAWAALNNAAWS